MIQFDGCIFFKRVEITNELCHFEARDSLAKWLAAMVDADGEAGASMSQEVMKISLRALCAFVCVCVCLCVCLVNVYIYM